MYHGASLSLSLPQSLSPSPSPSPSASQFLSPCLFVRFIILLWCNHLSCSKATNTHSAFIQLFNSYGHIVIESYSRIVIVYGVYIDLPRHATKFRQTWIANAIFRFIMLTRWVGKWTKLYTRCVYISTPPSLPSPSRSSLSVIASADNVQQLVWPIAAATGNCSSVNLIKCLD